jgi:putative DNA primase/helicase
MTKPDEMLGVSDETGWPTLRLLPSPNNPMAVARELLDVNEVTDHRLWWLGDFYTWTGTHWELWPQRAVDKWLYEQTEHAFFMTVGAKVQQAAWAPNTRRINDLRNALGVGILQRLDQLKSDDGAGFVAFSNGVLDLKTGLLLPHTPSRFNLHSSPFEYDANATAPAWLAFLDQVLESDESRINLLGEWFGYVLCSGTELHKIFSMFGPKRCGKGTVLRIIVALLGQRYVASPATLDSIAGPFGQQKFIGTRLATFSDVQWVGNHLSEAVGILLAISGEDHQDVAQKNRTEWKGKLQTRFMFAGNDRPKFSNTSGALAGRMEHLQFRISFYGREDHGLTERLMLELPGIFNWALQGWRRLQKQGGRFTQTELGTKAADDVERNASPVSAFVKDECAIVPGARIKLDDLHREFLRWRATERMDSAVTITTASLSRNLLSAFPTISTDREGSARQGNRTYWVNGIRLREEGETVGEDGALLLPDRDADRADRADRASLFDLGDEVTAGQDASGPGGPGGPGISLVQHPATETSAESTSSTQTADAIGELPGPPGPGSPAPPLTSANSGPGIPEVPRSASRSAWDREKWADGWDREPDEAA